MLNNKKYNLMRSESVYSEPDYKGDDDCLSGHYRSLHISPIGSSRVNNALKISATDPHISISYMTAIPFRSGLTQMPYLPIQFNSKNIDNSNVYSKAIRVIPKELFESLPESKVDPHVVPNPGKVCQTLSSVGTAFLSDSHTVSPESNNRSKTIGEEVFPRLPLNPEPHSSRKGFSNEEKPKSSVFTLVGRQILNSDKRSVKLETNDLASKSGSGNLNKCSGTLFTVLGSPNSLNRRKVSTKSDRKLETNDKIDDLSAKSVSNTSDPCFESFTTNDCNSYTSINENEKTLEDVKVSLNDRLNLELSVPQEVPIQSIKEFCRLMSEEKELKPNERLEANKVIEDSIHSNISNETKPFEERKQLLSLRSPTIVKEVMKKMAALPVLSSPGSVVANNVGIEAIDANDLELQNRNIIRINGHNSTAGSDAEALLVLQELDRSIAEGSPSNSNSPVIEPRLPDKYKIENQRPDSLKTTTGDYRNYRPSKPPRLLNHSTSTIEDKRKTLIEANETQTDNLIEELYLTDESGTKSNQTIDTRIESFKIESIVCQQNGVKEQNENKSLHKNTKCNQNRQNGQNIIEMSHNYNIKHISVGADNDLDGAIARASLSSVDSGTSSPNSSHFIVVAIDFGTTFSGYSFAFTRDVDNAIHMMRKVEGCDPDVSNQKIPTILLLTSDGAFHSFGFAARDHFSSLEPKEAKRWFYFEKFKMDLHYDESLSLDTKIKATNGNKSISALTVFAHALRYFKLLALQELSDQAAINILNEDIRWVLTVPAIWKPSAKQFMRAAAYEAGIGSVDNPYQLLIALEPEAASIYCRRLKMNQLVPMCPPRRHALFTENNNKNDTHLAVECDRDLLLSVNALKRFQNNDILENAFIKGTKYIVVDVGGGTVDITCHQIQTKEGSLKELHKAIGGPNGSIGVDLCFEKLLSDIFGIEFITQFKAKRPAGYVDLMAAFEARKRSASPLQTTSSNISLPFSFINFFKKTKGMTIENAVKKYNEGKGISYCSKLGMLRLEPAVMQQLFAPVTQQIISHISDVLTSPLVRDLSYLFLVGGFAESQILQAHIRSAFSSRLKVVIPQSPNLAILRGATIYGLDPTVISCRRARLTYGVGVLNKFIRGIHPLHKLAIKDDIEWCADVFDKFVICDQSIGLYESITRSYTPVNERQTCSIIHIYCTDREDVQFITDKGVHRCGTLYLDLDLIQESKHINPGLKTIVKREIQTQMIFGDTEIKVCALDVSTGRICRAEIDFLNN